MKSVTFCFTIAIFLSISATLSAQNIAVWQGGKPGRTTEWNCPSNWSEGRVPDEFTQVIIPTGTNYYPVIQYAPSPIDALMMEGSAKLTIRDGARLSILGLTGIFDGVTVLGQIENNGTIEIGESVNVDIALLQQVQGKGIVTSPSAGSNTLARRR